MAESRFESGGSLQFTCEGNRRIMPGMKAILASALVFRVASRGCAGVQPRIGRAEARRVHVDSSMTRPMCAKTDTLRPADWK